MNSNTLGYFLAPEGIKQLPKKIKALSRLKPPKNVTQLKYFLGMIIIYRDLWPRRKSHVLAPLTGLTSKYGGRGPKKKKIHYGEGLSAAIKILQAMRTDSRKKKQYPRAFGYSMP